MQTTVQKIDLQALPEEVVTLVNGIAERNAYEVGGKLIDGQANIAASEQIKAKDVIRDQKSDLDKALKAGKTVEGASYKATFDQLTAAQKLVREVKKPFTAKKRSLSLAIKDIKNDEVFILANAFGMTITGVDAPSMARATKIEAQREAAKLAKAMKK